MNEKEELLKKIQIENMIWVLYFGIIALCIYANTFEKHYIIYKDEESKEKYRKILITVFLIATIVYFYFFMDNYNGVQKLNSFDSRTKQDLNKLSLIASYLVLISGIIFLFIAINDKNLDVELAFS